MRLIATVLIIACAWAVAWDTHEYATLARVDPVLAMPGVALDAYTSALNAHQASARTIASYYPDSERQLLTHALVPSFLASLATTERARRSLIEQPSLLRALRYAYSLDRTLTRRAQNAAYLAAALRKHPSSSPVAFFDGTTRSATYATALDTVAAHSLTARDRARARILCLLRLETCAPDEISLDTVDPLSREVTQRDVEALSIMTHIHSALSDYTSTGPRLLRMHSSCSFSTESLAATWTRSRDGVIRALSPLPDIIVIDYHDAPPEISPDSEASHRERGVSPAMHAWLRERSVTYLYQPAGNFYYCTESGRDAATSARIRGVVESLPDIPLPLSSAMRHEYEVTSILDEYESYSVIKRLASLETGEARDAVTLWRSGTFGFDETIRALTSHDAYVRATLAKGDSLPVSTLLLMRTYPSVLYMPYNRTVDPSDPRFRDDDMRFGMHAFGMTTFEELSEQVPADELLTELRHGFSIMDELISSTD